MVRKTRRTLNAPWPRTALVQLHGNIPLEHWADTLNKATVTGINYWIAWFAFLNANIAFWATMALSMPDYTRFAKSQFAQTIGQISMPFMMLTIAFLRVMTTGAMEQVYHVTIWDPILAAALHLNPATAILI